MYLGFKENDEFIVIIFDNSAIDEQDIFLKKFLLTEFYKVDVKTKRKVHISRIDKSKMIDKDIDLIEYNLEFIYKAIDAAFEKIIKNALKNEVCI